MSFTATQNKEEGRNYWLIINSWISYSTLSINHKIKPWYSGISSSDLSMDKRLAWITNDHEESSYLSSPLKFKNYNNCGSILFYNGGGSVRMAHPAVSIYQRPALYKIR